MSETLDGKLLLAEGQKAFQTGKFTDAALAFVQAERAFRVGGLNVEAAEAANNASVAQLKAGDPAAALQSAEGTDTAFAAAGDIRKQGMAVANQAAALEGLGRLDEALERYTRAGELLKQCGEKELRAMVLKNISTLQLRTGKQLQALASMDAALDNQPKLSLRERLLHKLLRVPLDMLKRH
jgi:tetratricopeptide (TPR) repeat protein